MSGPPVFTIGYGSRSLAEFVDALKTYEIEFLIDVRSQPYSRFKPEFSKQPLSKSMREAGIRYVFMGNQLGGRPDDPDCYREGLLDYDLVETMPFYRTGIDRVKDAYEQQFRVALMCSEEKPEQCHRGKLIGRTLSVAGVALRHIDENDQLITQEEMMLRQNKGQLTLFGKSVEPSGESPEALLKRVFGFDSYRPMQADIIQNVLDKEDSLAIMPTGAGKSLCYQLPALIFSGLTVVVSPLISLMEDQVMQLQNLGIEATFLNSTLGRDGFHWTMTQIRQGQVRLMFAAPETLLRPDVLDMLAEIEVDCLTIDEAHCISAWGHDFRPEYRQLMSVRDRLPDAVCLALTATATERVRNDILATLQMPDAKQFVASFDRENLFLEIQPKDDIIGQTLAFLANHKDESGIIYCSTRKTVDMLADQLVANGYNALPYHAGLDDGSRRIHQLQFIRDDVPIMVATVAFGMGINKPNVRFILHVDLPKNVESYYQQIGRAGRDGIRAECLLLYSYSDVQTINYFIVQQAEHQQIGARVRLEAMLGFVESNDCRRRPLLAYFGEVYETENCGQCDNCTSAEEVGEDLTEPARKFLAAVVRTGQYFGTNHIIDVLRGSRNQKILGRGHDRLKVYNIGLEFSKKEWQQLARQFIQQGLLAQDMEFGSLRLTEAGEAVIKGGTFLGKRPRQPRSTPQSLNYDGQLFEILRRKRKLLADEQNVPPYIVLPDRSLIEMCTFFPHSTESFALLHGVGEKKVASYADIFVPIVVAYCEKNGVTEQPRAGAAPKRKSGGRSNRREEVITYFNEGKGLAEIMNMYGVKVGTVVDHLWKGLQAGKELRAADLTSMSTLDEKRQAAVLAKFEEIGADALRPIFMAFGQRVSYDDLHVLRLHYVINRQRS